MKRFLDSELILREDGSVYHIGVKPGDLAELILTVGDPERVPKVSRYFDSVDFKASCREFLTHSGRIGNRRISVISTGMGTDNVDIVMHEIDALFNIDFTTRSETSTHTTLTILRLGTTGLIQEEDEVDQILISEMAIDGSGLAPWYPHRYSLREQNWIEAVTAQIPELSYPGCHSADELLMNTFRVAYSSGVTYTASGFYHPQGRTLRIQGNESDLLDRLASIHVAQQRIRNIEMETAALYGLGNLLGHQVLSVNAALANRRTGEFSKKPDFTVDRMIREVLEMLEKL